MKASHWLVGAGLVWLTGASALLLFSSCASVERTVVIPAQVEGASLVGNKACADCHKNVTQNFPASAHARVRVDTANRGADTSCESCHGAGSKHVAAGGGTPGQRFIVNPKKDSEACFKCHLAAHAEFNLPYHHPVLENRLSCVECHDPHGHDIMKPAGGLAMARLNQTCAQCHREQARPFVFEHEALREGCTVCHQPHGSINSKLLTQRDANLCLRCHAQTPGAAGQIVIGKTDHSTYLRQGTCWSAGCHGAVHGSNINPHLRY